MKNNYNRLKWLAVVILAILLSFLAEPARAGVPSISSKILLQQEVRGVVTDTFGMPLPGVTVFVKGSNRGTTTNIDGKYSLTVASDDILVFSFLGFRKLEEPVNGRREVWVQLEEDISSLGELHINAGYYNTTKRESTGNISRVTAEKIELQPVISPLQALQGRMAGVEIIPGGSQPGMAPTIRIRGQNSLRSEGNYPLYIIDGVPINSTPIESNTLLGGTGIDPLNTINPSNIQSIEILKDADATAIYGSRGANGVVLITTKKGISHKTRLDAQFYTGAATVPNRIDLLNTQQYLQIRQRAFLNDDVIPDQYNAYDLVLWDQDRYTDWQEFFLGGTSNVTNINISTSGGNEGTSFRLGGSYHNQGTVYPGDFDYRKLTANFNLNHTSKSRKLNMDLSVNYGLDNNNLVGNVFLEENIFALTPNAPSIFLEDGGLDWEEYEIAGLNNPLEGWFNTSKTQINNLVSGFVISYQLFNGLYLKSNFGYTYTNSRELLKIPKRSFNPLYWENIDHSSSHLASYRNSWIAEPQINYDKRMGKGTLNALFGATFQATESNVAQISGEGYVAEALIGNLSAAERIIDATNFQTDYRYNAIFGRIGFNWDEKYLLNFTGRRDGSSRFGPGNKWANFYAVGSGWIFSEESFLKNKGNFLSFGKLRASYGTTGNDQIGDYGYLDAYEATLGPGGLYPIQLSNPDYSWEVNKKLEGAVELGFFGDRLNMSVSWYKNRSSNQLVGYPLPSTTGFTVIQANLPATVENKGWELELSSRNFQTNNFSWLTSLNLSLPRNTLIKYPAIEQSSYSNIYKVGHPLNISLLYQYEGLDPETGFYSISDVNDDGRFDYEDRTVIQNLGREAFGGINNNIIYRNLSLQFLWEYVKQEGTISLFNAGALGSQRSEVVQSLEPDSGFQTISASPQAQIAYSDVLNSNLAVVDASYIRLKTLSLSYTLPVSIITGTGLSTGKIFLNGQNLLTLTNYEGLDPEMPFRGSHFAGLRTISGGFQIQF